MNNTEKAIEALKVAEEYLKKEANDPAKYNTPLSYYLAILSDRVSDMGSEAKETNYYYG